MAISVQSYLKIDRIDQAEKQLKVGHLACLRAKPLPCPGCSGHLLVWQTQCSNHGLAVLMQAMSALEDDATLTQLATAWVDLFLVGHLLFCQDTPTHLVPVQNAKDSTGISCGQTSDGCIHIARSCKALG